MFCALRRAETVVLRGRHVCKAQNNPSSPMSTTLCLEGYACASLLSVPAWPVKQYRKTSCRYHLWGRDEQDEHAQHRFLVRDGLSKIVLSGYGGTSLLFFSISPSVCLRRRTARISDVPVQVTVLGGSGWFEVFILASEVRGDLVGGLSPRACDHVG